MPRLRFETARDLLDSYPDAADELMIEPVDVPSLTFLAELSGQQPIDKAIGFCAYLLPRREAVWWAAIRACAGAARQWGSRRTAGCGRMGALA